MYHADFQDETAIVAIKRGISALRDLRDALAQFAQLLAESPSKHGYLILEDSRIGSESLDNEGSRFTRALRPDVAGRLHLILAVSGELTPAPDGMPPGAREFLQRELKPATARPTPLPRPQMQSEVLRVLLLQSFNGSGPLTSAWLASTVGCSYRTVAAALTALGPAVTRTRDRSVELAYFPREAWRNLVATNRAARSTRLYVDRSGQPRSPEYLAQKVRELKRNDVAIGGVLGAREHCPSLDIVSAPRLDVCVHAPGIGVELLPIGQLDPGLEETGDPHAPARLAIHFVRRRTSLFVDHGDGVRWADPVECLLDLYEARLDAQAAQLLEQLE